MKLILKFDGQNLSLYLDCFYKLRSVYLDSRRYSPGTANRAEKRRHRPPPSHFLLSEVLVDDALVDAQLDGLFVSHALSPEVLVGNNLLADVLKGDCQRKALLSNGP